MDYIYLAEKRLSRLGFGMWPLSGLPKRPAWDEAIALIHSALDRGVSILDTADSYHLPDEPVGYGEVLVADALRQWGGRREDVLVATKGGRAVNPDGSRYCTGGPSQLTAAAEASRERLEVDIIDLYYFHRPDPEVPFAQSVEALAQLVDKGVIRTAGVSNVDRGQILVAKEILGESLVAVQNQYSFWFRSSESEIDLAADLGLAFFPWSPFGGPDRKSGVYEIGALAEVANYARASRHQTVLAWMLARYERMVPIPGTRRETALKDLLGAYDVKLDDLSLTALDGIVAQ